MLVGALPVFAPLQPGEPSIWLIRFAWFGSHKLEASKSEPECAIEICQPKLNFDCIPYPHAYCASCSSLMASMASSLHCQTEQTIFATY